MTLTIRSATLADTAQIVRLSRALYAVIRPGIEVEYQAVAVFAQQLMMRPDGLMLVAEQGGAVCGMLAASIEASPLSRQKVAVEHGWYCEARGGGLRLLRAYLEFAGTWGADLKRLTTPPDMAGRAGLRRMGFRPVELVWVA